jgi:3-oxoacyl-[acyl-carrier protein] reductase
MGMELKDHVALVTGSGSGIGKAIALRYAQAGANIAITDINGDAAQSTAAEVRKLGRQTLAKVTDVADYDQVQTLMAEVIKTFGKIDILVSNAGISGGGPLVDLSKDVFERVIRVHLFGSFYCSQAAAREMVKRKYGRIICMSSITALQGPIGANVPYGAAKSGILGLVRGMALELAEHNITVNAIAPGPTDTPMLRAGSPDLSLRSHHVPMQRLGNVADIANAAWFFALPASGYVTGTVLPIDGGAIAGGCYMVEYHRTHSQSR